jgi:hypothetical protein
VNKGGTHNLIVRALNKSAAEKAKALIEERMKIAAPIPAAEPSDPLAARPAKPPAPPVAPAARACPSA